jgi:hypothetical protein
MTSKNDLRDQNQAKQRMLAELFKFEQETASDEEIEVRILINGKLSDSFKKIKTEFEIKKIREWVIKVMTNK